MLKSRKIFAICDLEESYALRLTDYLNECRITPFEVQAFTNLESLLSFGREHHIELLLISTEAMNESVKELDVSRTIILYDGEPLNLDGAVPADEPMVYKYQSSEMLAREVMSYYTDRRAAADVLSLSELDADVYGVYSPVGRCGKTTFALTLGEFLGAQRRTLYLNLESYSGFEALFSQTYRSDLTDLVFLARKGENALLTRREQMLRTFRNLDYVPPAFFPCDLREIKASEWIGFIAGLVKNAGYSAIVLDIGHEPEDIPLLLRQCSRIYMPVLSDPVSQAKLSQFERDLDALSCADVLEKTVRLYLPKQEMELRRGADALIDALVGGEMGTFVRHLLQEEELRMAS